MFYDNYLKLCNSVRKTPSAVAVEVGFSKSIVSRWKNGGGVTDATVQKVADYFGVSVSDLLDEQQKEPAPNGSELSEKQKKIVDAILAASPEEFDKLEKIINAVLDK